MGAGSFLLVALVVSSNGGLAYPGKIDTVLAFSTLSTSVKTHSLHGLTTVYETICNQTSTGKISSTSSRILTKSSGYGSFSSSSTGSSLAPIPSNAQSASSHRSKGQSAFHTISVEQSSHISTAQSASSYLTSGRRASESSSASNSASQRSTRGSSSSPPKTESSELTSRSFESQKATSRKPNSRGSTSQSAATSSTNLSTSSASTAETSSSTTRSFSSNFSVPSGYTLVKLASSTSMESVPTGYSFEPLSSSSTSSSTTSSAVQCPTSTSTALASSILSSSSISALSPSSESSSSSMSSSVSSSLASSISKASTLRSSTRRSLTGGSAPVISTGQTISSSKSAGLSSTIQGAAGPRSSSYSVRKASITASINRTAPSLSSALAASSSFADAIASNASVAAVASASRAVVSSASAASAASVASVASVVSVSKAAARETVTAANCNDGTWDLTVANYKKFNTDANLKTWWHGGTDNETGVTFPAKSAPGTFFTEALAASFEPVGEQFVCTLESHSCQPAEGCANYAVHIPQGTPQTDVGKYFNEVGPVSHYGWFAIHSIANIFSFSETFTSGLTSAGIQIASENMQLTQTFTKPVDQDIAMRSILLGFALLVTILFAFVPVIGEVMGVSIASGIAVGASAIASFSLSSAGGFIGLSLANGATLDTKAATFGAYMGMIFNSTAGAIDQLVSQLMNGIAVNPPPGVTDPSLFGILEGGAWVNSSVITNPNLSVSAMTELMRDDLIQRGINYIWLQSKIYVTFANLNDDAAGTKCQANKNGWQASKTCADGGVYYLYRFNEDGNLIGHLDYPWGADKMNDSPFNLKPSWVTKSSAASYRAQNGGVGGFNYDQTTPPANLTDILTEVAKTGTLDGLRTLPGVWNLSVCDMGTHNDWNGDFTQNPMVTENHDDLSFFFPCCCGPNCMQTHDFIKSAQMENFKTIFDTCQTQLQLCKAWPPDVVSIDFGDAGTITNASCIQGDTIPL